MTIVLGPEEPVTIHRTLEVLQETVPGLSWSRQRVYLLCSRGLMPHRRFGYKVVFLESEIRRWVRDGGTTPEALAAYRQRRKAQPRAATKKPAAKKRTRRVSLVR